MKSFGKNESSTSSHLQILYHQTSVQNEITKYIIFGEALRIRVKIFKQNLRENNSKSIKIAITVCKFSKFLGEHAPGTPRVFFVTLVIFKLVMPKKRLEKNVEIAAPFFKISSYPHC